MEEMKRWKVPAFGNWENCDEMPITRYFDSVSHAGTSFCGEEDLFKVPVAMPLKHGYPYSGHCRRKVRQGNGVGVEKQLMKQGRGFDAIAGTPRRRKAPMAVDEDLYKIPPELLYQKPKRKKLLRKLLSGCMGLNCIN
ncbi:hypothetical protein M5K25_025175 [Dendrobium thyrsiflorum]|uniref:Uncharacterized protein n=1 Tax=Dendrobium thyrsiflorum TaxID=117978 RepID=A0ABD0U3Q7_DENTH